MSDHPAHHSAERPPADDRLARVEARILRRVLWRLMPLLMVCYVANYVDRVNVSFAKLQMNEARGFDDAVYAWGASIFFIGYFVFEVPSNLMLQRIGARIWIARIMISWGAISSAMLLIKSAMGFYLLRLVLGVAEAGFFPGIILYLTYWIPAGQRARAGSWFFTSLAFAGVLGGPLAGALLRVNALGLAGWQWLFLLEGILTVSLGLLVLAFLPNGPAQASWLDDEERRVLLDAIHAGQSAQRPDAHKLSFAFRNPTVWLLALLYCLLLFGLYLLGYWTPSIIKETYHGSNGAVGWLSAVPFACAVIGMLAIGRFSDRRNLRLETVAVSLALGAVGMSTCAFSSSTPMIIASLSVAAIGVYGAFAPFWSVPPRLLRGTAAAGGIALINSFGNLGAGFIGPNIVGQLHNSGHTYSRGLLVTAAALAAAALLSVILAMWQRRADGSADSNG